MDKVEKHQKNWSVVSKMFGEDGKRFLEFKPLADVYEEATQGFSKEAIEKVIKHFAAEDPRRMPAANKIKEKLTGISCDPKRRAVESAERIWSALCNIGWNYPDQAQRYLNDEEWEVVRLRGGWYTVCDVLTSQESAFKAQCRELLISIYERTSAGMPARLELKSGQESLLTLPPADENFEGDY
jgi:hypothetical protein